MKFMKLLILLNYIYNHAQTKILNTLIMTNIDLTDEVNIGALHSNTYNRQTLIINTLSKINIINYD